MKVVYIVDCISDLKQKIDLLKSRFGTNIVFVVRADLVDFFKTYGYTVNAIYHKNLPKILHALLLQSEVEDIVICYSSLKINNNLLNNFISNIGNKTKIVSIVPNYNPLEKMFNATYNVYVKSLFKVKDSLATNKLQFLPHPIVAELLSSHLGNRLFETSEEFCKYIKVDTIDKDVNNSMKVKSHNLKFCLLSIIIALVVTMGLLSCIAYLKANYLVTLSFIIFYALDLVITIIFLCKSKFDQRFMQ